MKPLAAVSASSRPVHHFVWENSIMYRKTASALAVSLALLLILPAVVPVSAAEQPVRFGPLLGRVPAGANTLIMLDVEAVRNSLFVTNTPASEKAVRAQVNRFVFGAKELDRAVLASNLDLNELVPVWEAVLTQTNTDIVLADVAKRENGRIEQLGSMQAVWLPSNGYLVPFTSRLIGMRFPADRAFVTKWANHPAVDGQNVLSPYLRQAASYAENVGTEIIMAIDLENVVDPGAVRRNLETTQAVQNKGVDMDELARVLASIRGATLGVRVTTNVTGSLRIDFVEDVSMTEGFAKQLILEKIADQGASLDEGLQWEARVEKNTMFLSGTLSVKGLRRVLTLIDPPTPELSGPSGSDATSTPAAGEATAQKTYDYFKALEVLVGDVKTPDTKQIQGTGELAIWMDRYAKKIDRMPILGVDEQLVDFAAVIAQAIRDMAVQFRGVGIEASKYSNNPRVNFYYGGYGAYSSGGYVGGAWGIVGAEKEMPAGNVARKIGRANVSANRADLWRQIDDDMASARRELTKRYQMEF